jgi:hypothetical protein
VGGREGGRGDAAAQMEKRAHTHTHTHKRERERKRGKGRRMGNVCCSFGKKEAVKKSIFFKKKKADILGGLRCVCCRTQTQLRSPDCRPTRHLCIDIFKRDFVYVQGFFSSPTTPSAYTYIHVHVCVCVCVCVWTCGRVCTWVGMHGNVHLHIYIT